MISLREQVAARMSRRRSRPPDDPIAAALASLSPPQREAVDHGEGPLLVISGAGSGKTRVLVTRTAHLIRSGVDPAQILVATFTNKAAGEFKRRLVPLLATEQAGLRAGTLHSTGLRLLRQHGAAAGFDPSFRVVGPRESYQRMAMAAQHLGVHRSQVLGAREWVSHFKGRLIGPTQAAAEFDGLMSEIGAEVITLYQEYQQVLAGGNELDLDDLVGLAVMLLRRAPGVQVLYGLQWLLVDEFQDTDPAQLELITRLLSPARNLTAVGDSDQAIYSFRGADSTIIRNFEAHFPGAHVVPLGQNYRSSGRIVTAAAGLITKNEERRPVEIWSQGEAGYPVIVVPCLDDTQEARLVATQILAVQREKDYPLSEFAILYRNNYQSQLFEDVLLGAGLAYHVTGSRFFERPEVGEAVLWLRLVRDRSDLAALRQLVDWPPRKQYAIPWDGLREAEETASTPLWERLQAGEAVASAAGTKVLHQAFGLVLALQEQTHAGDLSLPALLREIYAVTGLKDRWTRRDAKRTNPEAELAAPNLERLLTIVDRFFDAPCATTLPAFLEYVHTMTEDVSVGTRDAVQLMTLHAAKGSEFQCVFLTGLEQGVLPHWQSEQAGEEGRRALEEERRLTYVGMTRARTILYLTYAAARGTTRGGSRQNPKSQFLEELPEEGVLWWPMKASP